MADVDREVLDAVRGGFATVGALIERNRLKAALTETMRLVGEVNRYVAVTEPFKLKGEDERERLATVLHTLAQCVVDLNTMMAPFVPFSANLVHEVMGGEGEFMPMPVAKEVTDLDDGRPYRIITGEYSATPRWQPRDAAPGTPIAKPKPAFKKFDPAVVEEELERMNISA